MDIDESKKNKYLHLIAEIQKEKDEKNQCPISEAGQTGDFQEKKTSLVKEMSFLSS